MPDLTIQDLPMTDEIAWVENATPDIGGGKFKTEEDGP